MGRYITFIRPFPTLKIERKIRRKNKNKTKQLFRGQKSWGTLPVPLLEKGSLRSAAVPRGNLPRKTIFGQKRLESYYKLVWLILFSILLKHNEERKKKVLRNLHNIEHIEKTHSLTTTKNTRKLTSIISGQEEIRTFNIFRRFFVSKQELRFTKVYFQNKNTKVWIWYQW